MRRAAFLAVAAGVFLAAGAGVLALPASGTASGPGVAVDVPALPAFEQPTEDGTAVVNGASYDSVNAAIEAARSGDTVHLDGRFEERVVVRTPNLTLRADGPGRAVVDGSGEGDVVAIHAPGVTLENVWVRNSGRSATTEDAGIFLNGSGATLRSVRLTAVTFGVWVNGVADVAIRNSTIVGHPGVPSHAERGNGIHLWDTQDVLLAGNDVTRVRDGIYFSWSEDVVARGNRMWNLRYGVHYMYSNDNLLANNLAVENDVGYALMVSENLRIRNNTAIANRGPSGHGVLVKEIEDTAIRNNVLADNKQGIYVNNVQDSELLGNVVVRNDVGVLATAGSAGQTVARNAFLENGVHAYSTRPAVVAWNGTDVGNYWSGATTADLDGDGVSEVRHRPAGTVERLRREHPETAIFTDSPAFAVVRTAEASFPVLDLPGIVDHHPMAEPPADLRSRLAARFHHTASGGDMNGNTSD